jgi:RNA 3'-terminal phosphate cyclase (ATP)
MFAGDWQLSFHIAHCSFIIYHFYCGFEDFEYDEFMATENFITIDGSYGEGGGQILRTALSLAMITRQSLKLVNIRSGRKKPGLRPQHLASVQACATISQARVAGAELGSKGFTFSPGATIPGPYTFSIGTAGSATLVLQTLIPSLSIAEGESNLVVSGGTHVPWSPPYHYFERVFAAAINRLGFTCDPAIRRWGWYPKGGGEIQVRVKPHESLKSMILDKPFELRHVSGLSASSKLPEHVRIRQKKQAQMRLQQVGVKSEIDLLDIPAMHPGSLVFLCAQGKNSFAGFSALGARGKPAERVADEAAEALIRFLDGEAALDSHLADQILIYLALSPGHHQFTTSCVTQHLLTNAWVVEKFLAVTFEVTGELGDPGMVVKKDA